MFNRGQLLLLALAILGAGTGFFSGRFLEQTSKRSPAPNVTPLAIGDQRINLELQDMQGKNRYFSEWDGKLLLLNFWATWCEPCRAEMPLLETIDADYAAQGVAVVGVAIDEVDATREYLKDFPVRYSILIGLTTESDPSLVFGNTRNVLPYSVLIGRDGKLLAQHIGSFSKESLVNWLKPYL